MSYAADANHQCGGINRPVPCFWPAARNPPAPRWPTQTKAQATGGKPYAAQDFSKLKGMPGFSDQLLDLHFTLYQGYVKNTNLLLEQLQQLTAQNQRAARPTRN